MSARLPGPGIRQSASIERGARENAVVSSVKVVFGVSGRDQGDLGAASARPRRP
jgi:hypothetical protein